ncbi:MAG: hypothetical protein LKF31_08355 [Muribaculaceae bacterium]|nr:hypothetical protein [Muribaculaceae bacterium]
MSLLGGHNFLRKIKLNKHYYKSLGLYLIFIVIAFVFWLLLALNNTLQRDIMVPLKLTSVPDSVTIITDPPAFVRVTVRDKGASLLKFFFGESSAININFNEFADANGNIHVSSAEFRSLVRNLFDASATIISVSPDSLNVRYTNLPGKLVPVRLDLDAEPDMQYVINGPVTLSDDSVLVFSDRKTLDDIDEVYTFHVDVTQLKDTLVRPVNIAPIPGTKISPRSITITIPVEPLIRKEQNIPIIVKNKPAGVRVVILPSVVQASFLVPLSMYSKNKPVIAEVDYNDILYSMSNKLEVRIAESPAIYKNISLGIDSVEYVIDNN